MSDRYIVYGVVPSEHKDDNSDLDPANQNVEGKVIIYTTDDKQDADVVMREGGYIRNGQWYAAQELVDTQS